jgi:uncharacterized membrane protein YdjX (TVP38/TMEM64 family)
MDWLAQLIVRIGSMGPWAPVLFVVAYVLSSIFLAPVFLLTIAAGAIFGLWRGTLLVFVTKMLSSSVVFGLASPLSRSRLMRWADRDPRVAAVRRAVADDGVWVMFLLRLSPVVPFVLLNYALALSGVRYRNFVIAMAGTLPAIVMYVYYGKIIGDVAKIAAGVSPPRGPGYYVLLVTGLMATVLATTSITRASKRASDTARRPFYSGPWR